MELMKNHMRVLKREKETTNQFTMEEEFNVPDQKPDVGRLIQYDGKIQVGEVKISDDRVHITGHLLFQVLYAIDREAGKIDCLEGQIPFHEIINLDGIASGDKICLKWEIEDLNLQMIHSRKLNIRSLVAFFVTQEKEENLALPVDLREEGVSLKKENRKVLGLHVHNRDTVRIREEYALSSNKPDIQAIKWDSVDVRGVDVRAEEGKAVMKGEIFAFVLYEDENDSDTLQWLEFSIPFQRDLPCDGCRQNMIPDLDLSVVSSVLTVKPDADGEERIILADVVLEADLKVYYEENQDLLLDVYHPGREYVPVCQMECLERLLVKNYAKCKIQERVGISDRTGRILQICHSDGRVYIENSEQTPEGILIEGFVRIRILYITGEDEMPFYSTETNVPFSMVVEAADMDEHCKWYLHTDLEQLSTTMVDGMEIEIKALINLNALVLHQTQMPLITDIEVREPDWEKKKRMPGIVGYVVKQGDTLWDIAKRYYTSVEVIMAVNGLSSEEIHPKDTLILVKNVEG